MAANLTARVGTYVTARLSEHSTQVALGADLMTIVAGLQGSMTWQNVLAAWVGSIIPIFFPAK